MGKSAVEKKTFDEQILIAFFDDQRKSMQQNKEDDKERTAKKIYKSSTLCSKNIFEFIGISKALSSLELFDQNIINSIYGSPDRDFIKKLSCDYVEFESINITGTTAYKLYKKSCSALAEVKKGNEPQDQIYKAASIFHNEAKLLLDEKQGVLFEKLDRKNNKHRYLFYLCFLQYASKRNNLVERKEVNSILYLSGFEAAPKKSKVVRKKMKEYERIIQNLHNDILNKLSDFMDRNERCKS